LTLRAALVGNPNSGKTTLFNRLTGSRQSTGNWPGVTVEKKTGYLRHEGRVVEIYDLPGIYSLAPLTPEESIARDFLTGGQPDLIVDILDATNLERNLFLTLQLKKLGLPMVIALNMMDEVEQAGDHLDSSQLADLLGLPVIPVSARRGSGLADLIHAIVRGQAKVPGNDGQGWHEESDKETAELYCMSAELHDKVCQPVSAASSLSRSERIDRLMTHRILAIPLFFLIMFAVFQITFNENLGGRLTTWLDIFFSETVTSLANRMFELIKAPAWLVSLSVDGIIAGVGGILTFLPQIALLFLFLAILEDSGYMARAAFIMDRLFQHLGLSGRSFIPMLMGFGCTVPAVMAARTLENERERRLTILITPFMSCGARMPIYAYFAAIFFASGKGLVTFAMYMAGIAVAVLSAFVLSRTVMRGGDTSFVIELPPYRLPDAESLLLHVWDKVRDFIVRAGTIIFVMTVVVWFLQSFNFSLQPVADSARSIFGGLGSLLAPLFVPLGFGTWEAVVALLTGLIAKESVVATLEILYTPESLLQAFTPLSSLAFMTFTLLYTPCLAALGAIRREMGSLRWTWIAVGFQTAVAWISALLVFQVGSLLVSLA